ncbi:shikimate kinase [Longispora albida]|uniref:shikimate kinase n=1 Tax=Longispora albida TaxID=203523 RepID=UPI00039C2771|nr:shikimate kinase [Longispora albida]
MRRVSMVGTPGSGKTTLGRELAARLGVPYLELDSVYHQEGWEPLDAGEFQARVAELAAGDGWVIDGNYKLTRELIWERADTVVWFDRPRWQVIWRVTRRTYGRALRRELLWNGNREPVRGLWPFGRSAPENSVIAWAWVKHAEYRERYRRAAADPANARLDFVRIASDADARRLLARSS